MYLCRVSKKAFPHLGRHKSQSQILFDCNTQTHKMRCGNAPMSQAASIFFFRGLGSICIVLIPAPDLAAAVTTMRRRCVATATALANVVAFATATATAVVAFVVSVVIAVDAPTIAFATAVVAFIVSFVVEKKGNNMILIFM